MALNVLNTAVNTQPSYNQPVNHRIATFMKTWRERAGLTQTEAQRITGVKREYISSIELGRIAVIYPEVFNKLRHAYRFPGFEGLEAMGFRTDAGEGGVTPSLLTLLRGLDEGQQRGIEQLIRATLKLNDDLNS